MLVTSYYLFMDDSVQISIHLESSLFSEVSTLSRLAWITIMTFDGSNLCIAAEQVFVTHKQEESKH